MSFADLRISVLMGGPSSEHMISLKSGQGVLKALLSLGYHAQALIIPQKLSVSGASAFAADQLIGQKADVAFNVLHGPFGEDGGIQQVCEDMGMPYTGSDVLASRRSMDKWLARKYLDDAGLNLPFGYLVDPNRLDEAMLEGLDYPVVVKPTNQGSSLGVSLVRSEHDLVGAIEAAGALSPRVIIEAFIVGHEVTAGVLGDKVLPVVGIVPHETFFDFTAKYTQGHTDYEIPAPIDAIAAERVQAAALKAHQALGCRHLSRTDFILTPDNQPVVLEVNTVPGFTPTSLLPMAASCIGLSYENVCDRLVKMAYSDRLKKDKSEQKWQEEKNLKV